MEVRLFEHNARAYRRAEEMLEQYGRAAIVHPTGTGKSYIAFRLVEAHPHTPFLWLSPSEYIFQTQTEGLRRGCPDFDLSCVHFYTYARLAVCTPQQLEEIAAVRPAFIILDEFHRAGAQQWGQSVRRLLSLCPAAKLLGLTATHVRYLDNHRDMAEELFDGHIASEMTLGEAIVRGILPAPTYVTTVFHYRQELARLQGRIDAQKAPGVQDVSQKYLDALRRTLEQADGLDRVFARQMTDPCGKYIVFCAGREHMNEMIAHVPQWFAWADSPPAVYRALSEDPDTDREFAAFKADTGAHRKLLFCVDMLNEGVHVQGISGVVLFRPTISPIIYKQQIGRALTAGDSASPLILDVVNNFEGLCSIAGLQSEMSAAVQRLYANGEGDQIVTERFEVIEQVRDCRRLFEQLQSSLSSAWDAYFAQAGLYYAEHGSLNVPKRYVTPGGLNLGTWIQTQRRVRSGRLRGTLTETQIERLDSIGMVWEDRLETAWQRGFEHAQAYCAAHGDLLVPSRYRCRDGYRLGAWIANQRQKRGALCPDCVQKLDSIGMQWSARDAQWERAFAAAAEYRQREGNLLVPLRCCTADGLHLGSWIRAQRQLYRQGRLTQEQIERLNRLGMYWGDCGENQWQANYSAAKRYYEQHGSLDVPPTYKMPDGFALGRWVDRQRCAYRSPSQTNAVMTEERKRLLDEIGMVWQKPDAWEHKYTLAAQYKAEHGNLNVPAKYKTSDGIWLGRWLYEQKRLVKGTGAGRPLAPEQRRKLSALGIA